MQTIVSGNRWSVAGSKPSPLHLLVLYKGIIMIVDIEDFLTDEIIEKLNTRLLPDLTIVVNGDTLRYNGAEWELLDEKNKSAS